MDFYLKATEILLSISLFASPISGEVTKVLPCFQLGAAIITSVNQGTQFAGRFQNKK